VWRALWFIVTELQTLISRSWEASSDQLLGSAKPRHTEPSDWSAAKKTDDGYQGKGWSCWISSGLTICVRNIPCFNVFRLKIEQNSCVIVKLYIVKFNAVWGYWRFIEIRQRIFSCTDMQIMHFILKLLMYYTSFCRYSLESYLISKTVRFFCSRCTWQVYYRFYYRAIYAVMRCLSVRPSRSWIMAKRINISLKFFSPSDSDTILVFPYQSGCWYCDGNPPNGASNARRYDKMTIFSQISCSISKTLIVSRAHAARQFVSIEFSFHPYNIRDCPRGVPRGNKNVVKIAIFGLTHWFKHHITRKLLKTDRYMLRGFGKHWIVFPSMQHIAW